MSESRFGYDTAKVAYRLAVLCLVGAAILGVITAKSYTYDVLTSKTLDQWRERIYSRLWLAGDKVLGAVQQGSRLTFERLPGRASQRVVADVGSPGSPWAVALDGSRVAWVFGSTLYSRALDEGQGAKTVSIPLDGNLAIRVFSILPDRSAAILLGDATLEQWDLATGRQLGKHKLSVPEIGQVTISGDYLAIASTDSRLLLYRLKEGGEATLVEESRAPDQPFQLVIPSPGRVAMLTPGGVRLGGETRNSPGRVSSIALGYVDQLVAAGDFDGVWVLPQSDAPYKLADAAPGSVIAANATRLAVSGANGTSLVELLTEKRLTARGRSFSYFCILMTAMAALMAFTGFFWQMDFLGLFRKDPRSIAIQGKPDVPPELARACAKGETVLWAGAGLSAQSGFPTRHNFIVSLIQTAQVEQWIERALADKLLGAVARGEAEEALNQLVAAVGRDRLLQHFRLTFARIAALSAPHHALARLPLAAAITTNYDGLLERMGALWAGNILTLADNRHVQIAERGQFFVLKLFGDLSLADSVALCRSEFEAAASSHKAKQTFQTLFGSRTMLFVGCSLEGLVADLKALGVTNALGRRHVALAAVSANSWKKAAAELSARYGIDVLPCSEEAMPSTLREFLDNLAAEVERAVRGDVAKAVEAAVE